MRERSGLSCTQNQITMVAGKCLSCHIIHYLDYRSFIIFCVSLSEYNQLCYEDETKNRTKESLELFEKIVNDVTLTNYPLFLVFTKKDVFKQKLRYTNLSVCFDDCPDELKHFDEDTSKIKKEYINNWTGFLQDRQTVSDEVYEKAFDFMKNKFLERVKDQTKRQFIAKNIKAINTMDKEDIKTHLVKELFQDQMVESYFKEEMLHYL